MIFGLFHGLIVLPVILSIFGSDRTAKKRRRRSMTKEDEAAAAAAAANPAYVEEEVGDLAKDKAGGSKIGRAGADPDPLETAWAFLGLKDCALLTKP